jgi:hypothetical protein
MADWKLDTSKDDKSAQELARDVGESAAALARRQAAEATHSLVQDVRAASGLLLGAGGAALCGLFGLNMLTFTASDALARRMPSWAAKATVGIGALALSAACGYLGWRARPPHAFARTRAKLRHSVGEGLGALAEGLT